MSIIMVKRRKYRLPDNLTYDVSRGLFRYKNPITKKRTYLSSDKSACIRAAKVLNAKLQPADVDMIGRVIGGGQTWTIAVYRYESDVMPDEEWGETTRKKYIIYFRNLKKCRLGSMAIADIEVVHVVAALDNLTRGRRMRNIYRHLMGKVFQYTIELGWREDNPAAVTRKVNEKRRRMRLTMDGYRAVYAQADPWLRVAMDLSLVTLQRPEDLVMARYSDIKNGQFYMRQRKTGTKLCITVGPELQAVISASRDGNLCPFIIHKKMKRKPKKPAAQRQHQMQVFVSPLSRAFTAALRESGYYAQAKAPPPTFYEIKSLGGDRYRSLGWPEEKIQSLYGHKNKETTEGYLEGHEPPWERVDCG